jgi:beta-lactamase regulating signal transducer with metallopeptidase domain/plasmid maintenance system antidote protein VapI
MHIPDLFFQSGLVRALGWTVLHSLWQGALVALFAGIILMLLRNKSAQLRYLVANFALFSILFLSVCTFVWYRQATPAPEKEAFTLAKSPLSGAIAAAVKSPIPAEKQRVMQEKQPVSEGWTLQTIEGYFNRHLPLVAGIWFLGVLVLLLRLLGSILQVYALRQRMNFPADPYWNNMLDRLILKSGFNQGVELLESALVRSPLTIGHLRPLIMFPIGIINQLPESEVEAILAHELAHILRRDYLFNILQSLVECLFYYHPAVWWLSAQVRKEREHACDDRAIALLGNKITYAKALVAIQEMAFYPRTPALAFAGQRKGQLLLRVQRLFSQPKSNFNIMEKWISTALVVCLIMVLSFGQYHRAGEGANQTGNDWQNTQTNAGLWEAEFKHDSVHLTLTSHANGTWNMSEVFPQSSFTNLSLVNGDANFQMNRSAGKIAFTGKIEGNSGYGRFEFSPDEAYRTALKESGIKDAGDELLLMCFVADFPANYPEKLKKQGYKTVTKDELQELAAFRLNEPALKKYQDLAATLGHKQVSIDEIIQLKVSNVTSETVGRLAKAGYDHLNLEDVTQLSLQNVEPDYIEKMNNLGFGKLSAEQLLSAKIQGIDEGFVKEIQKEDLGKLDFDQVMSMKIQGITHDYIKQTMVMGLGNLNFDEIMSLKIQDIDSDFVKKAQNAGLGKLDFDQVMSMKIQGITPDYVKQAREMGLGQLGFDEIMSLKVQGITPDMVKTFRDLNFKNLTVDDLVAAKIQGVTPEFIKEAELKGYRFPTLHEYADLKVRVEWTRSRAN